MPEISTTLGPAGRDTMAAIAAELLPDIGLVDDGAGETNRESGTPEIEVEPGYAGRETMAAIASEMLVDVAPSVESPDPRPREPRHTVSYEDRPPTPAVALPRRARRATLDYVERPAATKRSPHGATLDDGQTSRTGESSEPLTDFEIHEMVTFVVRGELAQLASVSARRDFVRERLLHRLPVQTIDEVDRIDVTPWTVRGTVIVRVWCRI